MRPCTGIFAGERRFVEDDSDDSRSSSSLGRDSDLSGGEDCADSEVQSSFIKGPLDTMDVLEEVLPVKRGISKFYDGKSKSFTSLDATSASIKEFAKPENPYARKRKNLLPQINFLDWNSGCHLRDLETGTSKRTANSGGSTVVPGLTRSCSRSNNCKEEPHSMLLSSSTCPPPLHPHTKRTPSNVSCLPSRPQNFLFPYLIFNVQPVQVLMFDTAFSTILLLTSRISFQQGDMAVFQLIVLPVLLVASLWNVNKGTIGSLLRLWDRVYSTYCDIYQFINTERKHNSRDLEIMTLCFG